MASLRNQTRARSGLGLAGILFFSVAGCGGKGDSSDAVVNIEPGTNLSASAGTGAASAEKSSATASSSKGPGAPAEAASAPAVKAEGWGSLKGQVVFGGEPPSQEVLYDKGKAPKDEGVCAKEKPIMVERLIVDKGSKGVKNALVYIPKPTAVNPEAKSAADSAKVEFDQSNCVFKPHVIAFVAGSKITLKSSDAVNHNIDAKLKSNGIYNAVLNGGQVVIYGDAKFGERSPTEVICDIHPWMRAFWLVLDSPYFAVTDENGHYEIKNVPAGTQKVVVWQEAVQKGGFVTASSGEGVNVKAGADATSRNFTIESGTILPAK